VQQPCLIKTTFHNVTNSAGFSGYARQEKLHTLPTITNARYKALHVQYGSRVANISITVINEIVRNVFTDILHPTAEVSQQVKSLNFFLDDSVLYVWRCYKHSYSLPKFRQTDDPWLRHTLGNVTPFVVVDGSAFVKLRAVTLQNTYYTCVISSVCHRVAAHFVLILQGSCKAYVGISHVMVHTAAFGGETPLPTLHDFKHPLPCCKALGSSGMLTQRMLVVVPNSELQHTMRATAIKRRRQKDTFSFVCCIIGLL
jgi:hypothetical protein